MLLDENKGDRGREREKRGSPRNPFGFEWLKTLGNTSCAKRGFEKSMRTDSPSYGDQQMTSSNSRAFVSMNRSFVTKGFNPEIWAMEQE